MDKRKTLATYQRWIQQLQHLEKKQDFVWVNNGEVWRYDTGINVGNEVSFKRPCLVVKHSF